MQPDGEDFSLIDVREPDETARGGFPAPSPYQEA
jgi:rhodanese-related sulfurtransferase